MKSIDVLCLGVDAIESVAYIAMPVLVVAYAPPHAGPLHLETYLMNLPLRLVTYWSHLALGRPDRGRMMVCPVISMAATCDTCGVTVWICTLQCSMPIVHGLLTSQAFEFWPHSSQIRP